jgi:hypothetical protein
MPQITVKATVTPDHKLTVDVPESWPAGREVEAVLRTVESNDDRRARVEALRKRLQALQASGRKGDPAEMDERIRDLRESWE